MVNQQRIGIAFELAAAFIPGSGTKWCASCASFVPMVTMQNAAELENTDTIDIFRRAERGTVHPFVTAKGNLLVCLGSLLDAAGNARLS